MLTVAAAASRAGVSRALVYEWVSARLLSQYRLGRPGRRGSIRITEADLDAFMASMKRDGRQVTAPLVQPPPPKLKHLKL